MVQKLSCLLFLLSSFTYSQTTDHWNTRLLANNVLDTIGYNADRTSYLKQTDLPTVAGILTYTL